ncbi:hypothetical protein C8R45DRAFT_945861 [Mycena sanguinolenta]|nr:hypothetical protein C8R45DRAFT_945861 [Mycena sanguinolenta]
MSIWYYVEVPHEFNELNGTRKAPPARKEKQNSTLVLNTCLWEESNPPGSKFIGFFANGIRVTAVVRRGYNYHAAVQHTIVRTPPILPSPRYKWNQRNANERTKNGLGVEDVDTNLGYGKRRYASYSSLTHAPGGSRTLTVRIEIWDADRMTTGGLQRQCRYGLDPVVALWREHQTDAKTRREKQSNSSGVEPSNPEIKPLKWRFSRGMWIGWPPWSAEAMLV